MPELKWWEILAVEWEAEWVLHDADWRRELESIERGGEHMAKDDRTQQQKLHDRNTRPTGQGRQQDAKHQGPKKS